VAWMGYDQPRSLGGGETGGGTALPIWIRYMGEVLKSVPEMPFAMPAGVVVQQVIPQTGAPAAEGQGVPEYFLQEFAPGASPAAAPQNPLDALAGAAAAPPP
jgi:penicillin-binding protein 1A